MLIYPKFYVAKSADSLQYLKTIILITKEFNLEPLQPLILPLEDKVNTYEILLLRERKKTVSQDLSILDGGRDNCIMGLDIATRGFMRHYDNNIVQASTLLHNNIIQHGGSGGTIARLNLESETAVLDSIITDWESKPELIDAVIALNFQDWLTELKRLNTVFSEKLLERNQANTEDHKSIKTTREEAIEIYKTLQNHIIAHATIGTEGDYIALTDQINTLAKAFNDRLN